MGRKKTHTPEEIVAKLRQVEVLAAQGKAVDEAVRSIGVTEQTFYRWRRRRLPPHRSSTSRTHPAERGPARSRAAGGSGEDDAVRHEGRELRRHLVGEREAHHHSGPRQRARPEGAGPVGDPLGVAGAVEGVEVEPLDEAPVG